MMSEESQGYEDHDAIPYIPTSPELQGVPTIRSGAPFTERPLSQPARVVEPRKGRRGSWVILSIVVLLLLAATSSFYIFRYVNRPTSDKVLDLFCHALLQKNYRLAYDQFSQGLQKNLSLATFVSDFSPDEATVCTHGPSSDGGDSTTTSLKIVHGHAGINNDVVTLISASNSQWKINDIYRL
jgi:hypothetical protein